MSAEGVIDTLYELLEDLEEAYKSSDINKYCEANGHKWFYSLATTTLETGGPMIVGFNWGAAGSEKYGPQVSIEKSKWREGDLGSLSRILPYLDKYLGSESLESVTQTNYCLFRSKSESMITDRDIKLCEPIFEKLVSIIRPSSIICLSSRLRNHLLDNGRIASKESRSIRFTRGSSQITYEAIKAQLKTGVRINFLPHPNYPMKKIARDQAWGYCFEGLGLLRELV